MNILLKQALGACGIAFFATCASAQVTFYENETFTGRSFTAHEQVADFRKLGFNDRASSVIVAHERWEVCDDIRYGGRCIVLRPGRYPSLQAMGLDDRISSVRAVDPEARIHESRYSPAPVADDYRRRHDERIYEANVTSVRAVVGQAEQRCWVEREQVQQRGDANVPGAVVGAVLGGILGHQVGSGRGNDAATVGGAVVGGVVGANVGRDGGGQSSRDVQRCDTAHGHSRADYWDVTYSFRGQEHHAQMSAPPGRTITVNAEGEPRT